MKKKLIILMVLMIISQVIENKKCKKRHGKKIIKVAKKIINLGKK